jgi:hypothetical protein
MLDVVVSESFLNGESFVSENELLSCENVKEARFLDRKSVV